MLDSSCLLGAENFCALVVAFGFYTELPFCGRLGESGLPSGEVVTKGEVSLMEVRDDDQAAICSLHDILA